MREAPYFYCPVRFVGAQESLYEKVNLKPCTMDLGLIMTPSDYQAIAASTEQLEIIEDCMSIWVKQIEQVIADEGSGVKQAVCTEV